MGAELIPLLQMGIWVIVAIMFGMVALYIYLMRPRNKDIYTSNNDKFTQGYNNNNNNNNNNKDQYDDGLNTSHEDDGPIQNL